MSLAAGESLLWCCFCLTLLLFCFVLSESPSTGVRVPVNTSLHVFHCRPFTLIRVLYKCGITCEFHSYEQFHCRSCLYPTHTK